MKPKKPWVLALALILLFPFNSFAQSSQCLELFKKQPIEDIQEAASTHYIDNFRFDVIVENDVLKIEVTQVSEQRLKDWSLIPMLAAIVDASDIKRTSSELTITATDVDGSRYKTVLATFAALQGMIVRKDLPTSMREVGDFDKTTRLEAFQQTLPDYKSMSPARFRSAYIDFFLLYSAQLPLALVAAFRTEYFLDSTIPENSIAVQLVQAAYSVNSAKAISALEALKQKFLGTLTLAKRVEGSAYVFGLIPPTYNIAYQYSPYARATVKPNPFEGEAPASELTLSLQKARDQNDSYYASGINEAKHMMLDDLPYELIDISTVQKLRADFGILTVGQFALRVTGPMMMYDLGLTRNEIRDLYFYMRDQHHVYLNLTEDFAVKLHIFRAEFHK